MKKILTIILIVLAIGWFLFTGKLVYDYLKTEETTEVGRFKTFQGIYRVEDMQNNKVTENQALYLLDTATGEVKRHFVSISPSGATFLETWLDTEYRESLK